MSNINSSTDEKLLELLPHSLLELLELSQNYAHFPVKVLNSRPKGIDSGLELTPELVCTSHFFSERSLFQEDFLLDVFQEGQALSNHFSLLYELLQAFFTQKHPLNDLLHHLVDLGSLSLQQFS